MRKCDGRGLELYTRACASSLKMAEATVERDEGGRSSDYSSGSLVWYRSNKDVGWWPCVVGPQLLRATFTGSTRQDWYCPFICRCPPVCVVMTDREASV